MNNRSRRQFVKNLCIAAAASSSAGAFKEVLAATDGSDNYKALVCVFLNGGNDSFNMFVPTNEDMYQTYAKARTNLKIERDSLKKVHPSNTPGIEYGFHPSASELQALFKGDDLAVVANVGALTQPIVDKRNDVPVNLFSHIDQLGFWHTLDRNGQYLSGWGEKMMTNINKNIFSDNSIPNSFFLSSSCLWLSGDKTPSFKLNTTGSQILAGIAQHIKSDGSSQSQIRTNAFLSLLNQNQPNLLVSEFAKMQKITQQRSWGITNALNIASIPDSTLWPENSHLSACLKMVSKTISVRSKLGHKRDIFYVVAGGWDTHSEQLTHHAKLLADLSQSMFAFNQTMKEMDINDQVTTFTASEFGRTLTSNGDGTDHGWGSHHLIMGGAVKGGQLFGKFPDLEIGGIDDLGKRGRIIPTTSTDSYGATLAKWMGVKDEDLGSIFPNLNNFELSDRDIGFMKG